MFYQGAVFKHLDTVWWQHCCVVVGIFSLPDTGLSGLYYPLSNAKCHHEEPVLSPPFTLPLPQ